MSGVEAQGGRWLLGYDDTVAGEEETGTRRTGGGNSGGG